MGRSQSRLEERKRAVAEQIWLHYYNRVLYERGIIGREEWDRMTNRIETREGSNFHCSPVAGEL